MSGNLTSPPAMASLPNPFTPLAFMPKDVAFDATFALCVTVGCLSILVWDIFDNLHSDYLLLFKLKIKWPTAVYLISRLSALAYTLGKSIALTAEIENCKLFERALCALFIVSHASTTFLFFLRICAIYDWKRSIVVLFTLTWLAASASGFTIFFGLVGIHIGPTEYCTSTITHEFIQAVVWAELFNDTLVFFFLMFKLGSGGQPGLGTWKLGLKMHRGGMRRLTDALLEDTQLYYLVVVVFNFATVITYFRLAHPPSSPFRIFMVVPSTVIVNIMACRVFRNLKLRYSGYMPESRTGGTRSTGGLSSRAENGLHFRAAPRSATGMTTTDTIQIPMSPPIQEKSTEHELELEVKVTELRHVHVDGLYPLRPHYESGS